MNSVLGQLLNKRIAVISLSWVFLASTLLWSLPLERPFREWTLEEAVTLLTASPWARQETFTRVISGIGSGIRGEKEIYNTFFVRFLSARPIREAYARVQQIQQNYADMAPQERLRFDKSIRHLLELDVERWIVVAVSFRSNDADMERRVRQFWQSQTTETMRNRAFLSTPEFPQIRLAAFYPPLEESVGAKFVFPRTIEGTPVVSAQDIRITFELIDIPAANPQLRSTFSVPEMIVEGDLSL